MFKFENFRVRKLKAINALNFYITLCMAFLAQTSMKSETNAMKATIIKATIIKASDPIKEKVSFYYYRFAKGVQNVLSYAKEGVRLWFWFFSQIQFLSAYSLSLDTFAFSLIFGYFVHFFLDFLCTLPLLNIVLYFIIVIVGVSYNNHPNHRSFCCIICLLYVFYANLSYAATVCF